MASNAQVLIIMGSDSDLKVMESAKSILDEFNVSSEMHISSAHRTPERTAQMASGARDKGVKIIIAGAGMAAHLAGVIAAHTTLPVIGVPLDASLGGIDAYLSTLQMPPGVPVATMSIGKAGAKNAALLAVQILALSDAELADKLVEYKNKMASSVIEKDNKLGTSK
ncbi:5-(carboxyamino)imidazole ribonucleotide mutase [bacterium]|nr:5-(carboxyamino)imidazole ribonucleotide mutase [bacterium]